MNVRLNILLANMNIMYYPIHKKKIVTAILIFVISLTVHHSSIFAEILDQSAENYRDRGYEEQQKRHFEKALAYYTKALSLGLENATIYNDLGVVYEQINLPQRAEQFYLKAIDLDQDYLPPYTNLAYFYQSVGDTQKAIYYFNRRLARAEDGDPWKERITKELFRIDPVLKERSLREELDKVNEEIAEKEQKTQAEKQAKVAKELKLQMTRAEQHYQQALQFLADSNFEQAFEELDRALTVTPHNPKIIKARKRAIYTKGIEDVKRRTDDAIRKLDEGDLKSAKKEFQQILATIPNESNHKSE